MQRTKISDWICINVRTDGHVFFNLDGAYHSYHLRRTLSKVTVRSRGHRIVLCLFAPLNIIITYRMWKFSIESYHHVVKSQDLRKKVKGKDVDLYSAFHAKGKDTRPCKAHAQNVERMVVRFLNAVNILSHQVLCTKNLKQLLKGQIQYNISLSILYILSRRLYVSV